MSIEVLVVDEEPEILELTATFLERESDRIEVTTEQSAPAAVERITDEAFDAVVSDLKMPEMDGLELLASVRETVPGLPVFILSGAGTEEDRQRAAEAGASGYVQKRAGVEHYADLAEQIEAAVD